MVKLMLADPRAEGQARDRAFVTGGQEAYVPMVKAISDARRRDQPDP